MKKKIGIVVVVLLVLGIAVAMFLGMHSRRAMPVYHGKTAQQWLGELHSTNQMRAFNALHAMGSNAVPAIVWAFQKEDSAWDRFYQRNYPKLPSFLQSRLSRPMADAERWALAEMAAVNVWQAKAAVPDFMRLLAEGNSKRQAHLLVALINYTGPDNTNCLPALINCLQSTNLDVRLIASTGLARFGPGAREAVPALTNLINSLNSTQRQFALQSLKKIDPDTAARYETK